jgi:hypothetical protein
MLDLECLGGDSRVALIELVPQCGELRIDVVREPNSLILHNRHPAASLRLGRVDLDAGVLLDQSDGFARAEFSLLDQFESLLAVSDISDPVGHISAGQAPKDEIADAIGAAQANAQALHDAGVAWRKVAPAATGGTGYEINAIAGWMRRPQAERIAHIGADIRPDLPPCGKAVLAQPLADFF